MRLQQLDEKEARITELHKQNQQAQANLEHYRTAMAEQRQTDNLRHEEERRRLETTIRQLEQQNSVLKHEKAELDKAFAALQQRHEAALLQSDAHLQSRDNLTSELNQVKLLLAQKAETSQHWHTQYEGLFTESKAQADKIVAFQTEIAVLNEQLSMLKSELDETKAQNRLLVSEKWELGQEKAQLVGEFKQLQQTFLEKSRG